MRGFEKEEQRKLMKNETNLLNKKTLTKLLNADFRKGILDSYRKDTFLINDYARYVVDSQILQRMKGYENDPKAGWGFPQLNILCCIREDGSIDKKFFEFKTVNHFLKEQDGDSAVEVVKCILILWARAEKKTLKSFDYEKIDAELVRLDKEIADKQAKEQKINETGKRIHDIVRPVVDQALKESFDVAAPRTKERVEKILEQFKEAGDICKHVVSLDRNDEASIKRGEFHMDIGYKLEENDDFTILVCDVRPPKEDETKKEKTGKQD